MMSKYTFFLDVVGTNIVVLVNIKFTDYCYLFNFFVLLYIKILSMMYSYTEMDSNFYSLRVDFILKVWSPSILYQNKIHRESFSLLPDITNPNVCIQRFYISFHSFTKTFSCTTTIIIIIDVKKQFFMCSSFFLK